MSVKSNYTDVAILIYFATNIIKRIFEIEFYPSHDN